MKLALVATRHGRGRAGVAALFIMAAQLHNGLEQQIQQFLSDHPNTGLTETKGSMNSMELREVEKAKIECARKHFECLCSDTVKYDVVDSYESLINMIS